MKGGIGKAKEATQGLGSVAVEPGSDALTVVDPQQIHVGLQTVWRHQTPT